MEWIKLASEKQLPKDRYFLLINAKENIHHIDLMINDRWDHYHQDNKWCDVCHDEKDTMLNCYSGTECSVNYFEPDIKDNYTHFCIIESPE